MTTAERARVALRARSGLATSGQGYVNWPQDNLVAGVRLEQFESDLRRGDGNELQMKFCAVHSSAALAVNCFAPFKERPTDLELLGQRCQEPVEFERPLRIFRGGRPPNLDVWADQGTRVVAIESKLLEYLSPKAPAFSPAYDRLEGESEPRWWAAYAAAKDGPAQHLDRAQLVKHYFGLQKWQRLNPSKGVVLLYLFWEPANWRELAECVTHREQVEEFSERLYGSSIQFTWTTYPRLWSDWLEIPRLEDHARNLQARYETPI
jgi:hypothetical protein